MGAVPCRAVDCQVAGVGLNPILQPAQPLALLQRCTSYSAVGDVHEQGLAGAPNTDRSFRHAGVLRHIGQGFGDHKVGRLFDTGSKAFTVQGVGNPDMNAAALSQSPQRRPEARLHRMAGWIPRARSRSSLSASVSCAVASSRASEVSS